MGGVPIPTRGIHCSTLYMYVLCASSSPFIFPILLPPFPHPTFHIPPNSSCLFSTTLFSPTSSPTFIFPSLFSKILLISFSVPTLLYIKDRPLPTQTLSDPVFLFLPMRLSFSSYAMSPLSFLLTSIPPLLSYYPSSLSFRDLSPYLCLPIQCRIWTSYFR